MLQLVEELVSSGQGTLSRNIAWELSQKGTIIAGIPMGIQKESGAKPLIQFPDGSMVSGYYTAEYLWSTVLFRYVRH